MKILNQVNGDNKFIIVETFQNILQLKNDCEKKLVNLGRRAETGRKLLNNLYSSPVVSVSDVRQLLHTGYKSANNLIKEFVKMGILKRLHDKQRNRQFIFMKYVAMFYVPEEH